jgi:glycerophosphoryl diester phosphodiesterase
VKYRFAHRGGRPGPDNTLVAFASALDRGAQGLETDAWLTADGAVILDHDGVARHAGRQAVSQVRRDQLPAHIPTLDELYETCGTDYALANDVRSVAVAASIITIAVRHKALHNLWLVTPAVTDLAEIDIVGAHHAVTLRGNTIRSGQRAAVLRRARDNNIEAVNARWMWWTTGLVAEVHSLGMLAFGYDAQRPAALRRCVSVGLDGVFSDHVDRMLAAS